MSGKAKNISVVWCRNYLRSTPLVKYMRVTSLQLIDDAQIDARQIIRVSGHKNTDSLLNNARRISAARKRNISSILSNSVSACPPTSTPSKALATPIPVVQSPIAKDVALAEVPDDIDTFISSIPDELLLFPRQNPLCMLLLCQMQVDFYFSQFLQNITINFCWIMSVYKCFISLRSID